MIIWVKLLLNYFRNVLIFNIFYPWVLRGQHVHCQLSTRFWSARKHIHLGNYVGIGHGCTFQSNIDIGDKVMIANNVAILSSDDHHYDVVGKTMWDSGRGDKYMVRVEDDVWIGYGSIILSPVTIGRGSIIAAGSVVTKDVPRYSIVGGIPARVLKMRFSTEEIDRHERIIAESHSYPQTPRKF